MSQASARLATNDAKSQVYVGSYPVVSRAEAEVLAKGDVWTVLTYLHRKGPKGATADEIAGQLGISLSVTYSTLKELHRFDVVHVYSRAEGRRKIRKKAYACRTDTWGQCRADVHFADAMKISGELEQMNRELNSPLLQALGDAYTHFAAKRELHPYLPSDDPGAICPKCNRNHEAVEFFCTMCFLAIQNFISESKEFEGFLTKRKFTGVPPTSAGS